MRNNVPGHALSPRAAARLVKAASYGFVLILLGAPADALGAAQIVPPAVPQEPAGDVSVIIKSQHRRLPFTQDIQRIAVADTGILSAELINSREVLVLGRETGRTTLIVWFTNGTSREYLFSVQFDLSLLENALRRVHPSIAVEHAPDRDALVLTGLVPSTVVSQAAEAMARNYLDAGLGRRGSAQPIVALTPPAAAPQAGAPQGAPPPAPLQLQGAVPATGAVINLIQLETLPQSPEQKILDAIAGIGGRDVTVRRMLRGNVRNDAEDTLVLEGQVPNQVALVRVLAVAAQVFAGDTITADDIEVVADEAGALAEQALAQGQSQTLLGGGASSSLFGGNRRTRLTNQVSRNLGRAKAIQVSGGRILSFVEVSDLPQIRVDVRLLEVNRAKLRTFDPSTALLLSDGRQPSLNPARGALAVQGAQAARVGAAGRSVQDVLSFLGGTLLNQFQFAGDNAAVDLALSLLERQGIARSLSSPSLTVLSGELAEVQVGGEVPVPVAFAPGFGVAVSGTGTTPGAAAGSAGGVFSSVEFVPFGVQLQIRPLVGDDDTITLDVQPTVVTPDAILTDAIRQTTGSAVPTTAFQSRALRTSSRLQDGQVLIIGGLISNNSSNNAAGTPGLRHVPLFGHLFQSRNSNDESLELVIVVNPVILRTPIPNAALWAFPDRDELLRTVFTSPAPASAP